MKKLITLIAISCSLSLNAQMLDWAYALGADNGGEYGRVIKRDNAGNTYIGGRLFDMADFDVTSSFYFLSPSHYHSGYIAKYDPNMELLWAKDIGGPDYQDVWDMLIDGSGNVYVTGSYKGSINFGSGSNYTSVGQSDIFLAKYSSNGQLEWAHGFGSASFDRGNALALDADNNIYVAGYFSGNFDIDPGPSVVNMFNSGASDGFVAKFTSNGDLLHRLYIGGTSFEEANGIGLDSLGNVYLTGTFNDGADFILGNPDHFLNTLNIDIFIAKYDSTLLFEWAYDVGGGVQYGSNCQAHDIVVMPSGEFAISGIFWGPAQFDPLTNSAFETPGAGDMFIARYSADADFHWVKHVGMSQAATAYDLEMDESGNFYGAGSFYDSLDFDPGPGIDHIVSQGHRDPCVWSLDANGEYRWTLAIPSAGNEDAFGIEVVNDSTFLLTGDINDVGNFNPNGVPYTLGGGGLSDIFIAQYSTGQLTTTGVDELEQIDFQVYPNPATDQMFILLPEAVNGDVTISLFDAAGRLCYEKRVSNTRSHAIQRNDLTAGMYLLQVRSDDLTFKTKNVVLE